MTYPTIQAFFDAATHTVSYVVFDDSARTAAIVDPVLDYEPASAATSTQSADRIVEFVSTRRLNVAWILETHIHADHLSAASYLRERVGGKTAIGSRVNEVQETFGKIYNLHDLPGKGDAFDRLLHDGDSIDIGNIAGRVIATPGHTPACVTYVIGDAAFVGDTLFMPDFGTARTDFPGGSAAELYRSIQRILALPAETRLFMCHDYKAPGRNEYAWETTVADQKRHNVHIGGGVAEHEFVTMRETRDAELSMPALILPSIQVNIRGGRLPDAEDNAIRYLKIPLDTL